ncbi:MAG TPA: ATP-grasp domain-containing protein [Acidobacteriota bacterium]|nr:ATP-grasp domain-containing protein [Acidobacteriota bacterium]
MVSAGKTVLVLFNHLEENDEYLPLRTIDPASLNFKPKYKIHVATAQEEYDSIVAALNSAGYRARCLNLKDDFSTLCRLISQDPPDVIFNLVEFFHNDLNNEGAVASLFDLFGVPYTGAPPLSLSLCRRKGLTKQILAESGIPTPRFITLERPIIKPEHGLKYPLILKPSRQDGSAGLDVYSVVSDYPHLLRRLDRLFADFKSSVLVEEFVEGQELHVPMLGNDPAEVLPVIGFNFTELSELEYYHPPLITHDIKWNPLSPAYHKVHSLCPAELDRDTEARVKDFARRAFIATGCRDYARIDVRLGSDDTPYILEVNPNPDLTEGVSFMQSAETAGLGFAETLSRIVEFALERAPKQSCKLPVD